MKKSIAYASSVVALAIMLAMSLPTSAAAGTPTTAPGKNKLLCFADAGGVCKLNTSGAKGSATLDTTLGGDAGVFYSGFNASIYGVNLSLVTQLSFTLTGAASLADPHFSVPINEAGVQNAPTDAFAFIPASTCNNGAGLVDVINNTSCLIYYKSITGYANWAAFHTAFPTAIVAFNNDALFIIADSTTGGGVWTVNNVIIGKPGK